MKDIISYKVQFIGDRPNSVPYFHLIDGTNDIEYINKSITEIEAMEFTCNQTENDVNIQIISSHSCFHYQVTHAESMNTLSGTTAWRSDKTDGPAVDSFRLKTYYPILKEFNANLTPSFYVQINNFKCLDNFFRDMDTLEYVNKDIFKSFRGDPLFNRLSNTFNGCSKLDFSHTATKPMNEMFKGLTTLNSITGMMEGCGTTVFPTGMLNDVTKSGYLTNMERTFYNNDKMTGTADNYWDITPAITGTDCFYLDTQLDNYIQIPESWGGGLYFYTFLNAEDYNNRINDIRIDHNNDFSKCIFTFKNGLLNETIVMPHFIEKSPKYIEAPQCTSVAEMFKKCWYLKEVSPTLFSRMGNITNMKDLFNECVYLESIPEGLFGSNFVNCSNLQGAFKDCVRLETIPENIFVNMRNISNIDELFMNCDALAEIPLDLLSDTNTSHLTSCNRTFYNTAIGTQIPALWNYQSLLNLPHEDYAKESTFAENILSIPQDWGGYEILRYENITAANDRTTGIAQEINTRNGDLSNCVIVITNSTVDDASIYLNYNRAYNGKLPVTVFHTSVTGDAIRMYGMGISIDKIPKALYRNCTNISTLRLPSSDTIYYVDNAIHKYFFRYCTKAISVERSPSITRFNCSIDIFKYNIILEEIYWLPDVIGKIPADLFKNMPNLRIIDGPWEESSTTVITEIPEDLFRYNPLLESCRSMFQTRQTTTYTSIPENLFKYNPKLKDLYECFRDNNGITELPANLFANNPELATMNYTFAYCTKLRTIPADLFKNCPELTVISSLFSNCTELTSIQQGFFANNTKLVDAREAFKLTKIQTVPDDLFANCPLLSNLDNAFQSTKITTLGENFFGNNSSLTSLSGTFGSCKELASVSMNLFKNCPNISILYETFFGADISGSYEHLLDYNDKITNVYRMFGNCFNITKIPKVWEKATPPTSVRSYILSCYPSEIDLYDIPVQYFGNSSDTKLYTFTNAADFNSRINTILTENNYYLSNCVLRFANGLLNEKILFPTTIIRLPIIIIADQLTDASSMFEGCTELYASYDELVSLLYGMPKLKSVSRMFYGCQRLQLSLQSGLNRMFTRCPDIEDFSYTFCGIYGLDDTSNIMTDTIFKYNTKALTFEGMFSNFYDGNRPIFLPKDLFKYNTKAYNFKEMFAYANVVDAPEDLFSYLDLTAHPLGSYDFTRTFYGCQGMFSKIPLPPIPYSTTQTNEYATGCVNAPNYYDLPEDTLRAGVQTITFSNATDFNNRIASIVTSSNYNLSKYIFRFTNGLLNESVTFPALKATPITIYADQCTSADSIFYTRQTSDSRYVDLCSYSVEILKNMPKLKTARKLFNICSMVDIPKDLFKYNTELVDISGAFYSCLYYGIRSQGDGYIPEDLFRYNTKLENVSELFSGIGSGATYQSLNEQRIRVKIPDNIFKYNTQITDISGLFSGLSSSENAYIDYISENMFDNQPNITNCCRAFNRISPSNIDLIKCPPLWKRPLPPAKHAAYLPSSFSVYSYKDYYVSYDWFTDSSSGETGTMVFYAKLNNCEFNPPVMPIYTSKGDPSTTTMLATSGDINHSRDVSLYGPYYTSPSTGIASGKFVISPHANTTTINTDGGKFYWRSPLSSEVSGDVKIGDIGYNIDSTGAQTIPYANTAKMYNQPNIKLPFIMSKHSTMDQLMLCGQTEIDNKYWCFGFNTFQDTISLTNNDNVTNVIIPELGKRKNPNVFDPESGDIYRCIFLISKDNTGNNFVHIEGSWNSQPEYHQLRLYTEDVGNFDQTAVDTSSYTVIDSDAFGTQDVSTSNTPSKDYKQRSVYKYQYILKDPVKVKELFDNAFATGVTPRISVESLVRASTNRIPFVAIPAE